MPDLNRPPSPPPTPEASTLGALLATLEQGHVLLVGGRGTSAAHLAELGRDLLRLGLLLQVRAEELQPTPGAS